jgi:hypothetical protein
VSLIGVVFRFRHFLNFRFFELFLFVRWFKTAVLGLHIDHILRVKLSKNSLSLEDGTDV